MEFKDRVANKPNRVKLTYEDSGASAYATVELADEPIENGTPLNKSTFDEMQRELNAYVVGNVLITSDNTNPSSYLGGTWELIDKSFKSSATNDVTQFLSADTDGITCTACSTVRSFSNVRIRCDIKIDVDLDDIGQVLGNFDFSKVGISSLPMGYKTLVTANDAANGAIVWGLSYDGIVSQGDVLNQTSIKGGLIWTLDIIFNVVYTQMLDEFCDKFYWKRIK